MGKVEDRQSGGGWVGKEGWQEILELLVGALLNCEDACQPYAKGHPIGCNDAEGRNAAGKL